MAPTETSPQTGRQRRRRGRWGLILIALLFFVPIWSAMYLVQHWRPAGTVNNGVLVDPLRSVESVGGELLGSGPMSGGYFADQWTLVYRIDGACEEACQRALYNMRQVRVALGKDMDRVQRLVLVGSDPDAALSALLAQEHQGIDVLVTADVAPFDYPGSIHFVDPLGNLMMYYPPGAEPTGMLDDLKRLLKLSKVG